MYAFNTIAYSTIIGIFIETMVLLEEESMKRQDIIEDADDVMIREGISPILTKSVQLFFQTTYR